MRITKHMVAAVRASGCLGRSEDLTSIIAAVCPLIREAALREAAAVADTQLGECSFVGLAILALIDEAAHD